MKAIPIAVLLACTLLTGCGDSDTESSGADPGAGGGDTASSPPPTANPETPVSHPLPGDPEAGKVVYMRICSACHQPDGSGMNGLLAADFVKDKTRLAKPNEELLNSIRNGIIKDNRIMPPQKDILSDTEIKDALSYIRKTFGSAG